jgi:hypothetical protein
MDAAHQLLEASSGKTIDAKIFAIASMGQAASLLLTDVLYPRSVDDRDVTFQVMKDALLDHLRIQHLEMAERAKFYATSQKDGESASTFLSRLKKAAEFCKFQTSLTSMLRDRLVLGCSSREARTKLLTCEPLTLQGAYDQLQVSEAVELAKASNCMFPKHDSATECASNPIDFAGKEKLVKGCGKCGSHSCRGGSSCSANGKTCRKCGKQNHFQTVCRGRPQQVHEVDEVASCMYIEVPTHSTHSASVINVLLGDHQLAMEVDTGAAASLISEPMWRALGSPKLKCSKKVFSAYDGHRMKPLGELHCTVRYGACKADAVLTVVQSSKPYGLLGRDLITKMVPNCIPIHSTEQTIVPLPHMKVQPVTIEVESRGKFRFCPARPVPLPMREKVRAQLHELQQRGIITPVSVSRCASPVVWVKKRDGSLRLCADFKVFLNDAIKSDAYPLPAIETIFSGMGNATHFAKVDLKDAYWQIPLSKASREICTINTVKGLYQLTRLPKGMKNSSAIFQRVMEDILKDIAGVVVYQDDILIHAISADELAKRVSSVIGRLDQKRVTINKEKSAMIATKMRFLVRHSGSH